ncbi:MAG: TonB-dependent receptor [Candidatus Kapabacteria bacterium]|nr:TonB-dependent receptor [Candidatus Kapabacteria bacterium]
MIRRFLLFALPLFILIPVLVTAGTFGVLTGTVSDKDGKPVVGASVLVQGTTLGAYTKANGRFTVLKITAGSYTVKISGVGYADEFVKVRISADATENIIVTLKPKDVTTKIVYVDAANNKPMVSKTAVGSNRNIEGKDNVRLARENVAQTVTLQAGVQGGGNGFIIRGSRVTETQVRVDGLDVGDQISGGLTAGGNISNFAVEEVQVLTGAFAAEYGNAMGGIVNTVVKTGRTDKIEAILRYRTVLGGLNGAYDNGLSPADPKSSNYEVNIGGPLPFLSGSTFFISSRFDYTGNASATTQVIDPWGNNLGIYNNPSYSNSILPRLKINVASGINLIFGGQWSLQATEDAGWAWRYATDHGFKNGDSILVPESRVKQGFRQSIYNNAFVRLNQTLSENSFYEFTVSTNNNTFEGGRYADPTQTTPSLFTGFNPLYPEDRFAVGPVDVNGVVTLVNGRDRLIDPYTSITAEGLAQGGFLLGNRPTRNPLTGYIEGPGDLTGTTNPYALRQFAFLTHGNNEGFEFRTTNFIQLDGNYNLRLETEDASHMIKAGFETRFFTLHRHNNGLPWDANAFFDVYTDKWGGNPYVSDPAAVEKTSKPFTPVTASAFVQDQISYKGIIINAGLRFDYMNSNSLARRSSAINTFIPIDAPDSLFSQATPKFQVSPRLFVSYPITDRSVFSVSYGIFYQMPQPNNMYDGFNTTRLRGNQALGDPNIDVQRTNQYQVGYNLQVNDELAFDVTAYYKDIYNQVGVRYVPTIPDAYSEFSVGEYGSTRGVEFTLRKRPSNNFATNLNYTIASARGTASNVGTNLAATFSIDPFTGRNAFPLTEYFLSSDVRHRINADVTFFFGRDEGPELFGVRPLANSSINLLGTFRTGTPYTKLNFNGIQIGEFNGERQPANFNGVDIRFNRQFYLKDILGDGVNDMSITLFADIFNVMNRTVPVAVFARTGSADDDGLFRSRQLGDFASTPLFETADINRPETIRSDQFDTFGRRLYSVDADFNKDGVNTQQEVYRSYQRWVKDVIAFQGNYQGPRSFAVGFMLTY